MSERGAIRGPIWAAVVAMIATSGSIAQAPDSDPQAMAIADAAVATMGGRQAWDETRYLSWNFFGHRAHLWDKKTGDVRIEAKTRAGDQVLVLMNLGTKDGRAWKNGQEVAAAEERSKLLQAGYAWWVNDAYWIFMPYKLRDPGVRVRSKGEVAMQDGRPADCLELTFDKVGMTPQNRYLVYVAKDSKLIEQWDYFENASQEKPDFQIPWHGWKKYGRIMLSGDRGKGGALTDIAVHDTVPPGAFTSPAPVEMGKGAPGR